MCNCAAYLVAVLMWFQISVGIDHSVFETNIVVPVAGNKQQQGA